MAQTQKYPLNLMVPPEQAFYAALSAINDKGFTLSKADIAYSAIAPVSDKPDANTSITLTPVDGSRLVMPGEPRVQYYTRYSLPELLVFQGYPDTALSATSQTPADWDDAKTAALTLLNGAVKATISPDRIQWVQSSRDANGLTGSLVMQDADLILTGAIVVNVTFSTGGTA